MTNKKSSSGDPLVPVVAALVFAIWIAWGMGLGMHLSERLPGSQSAATSASSASPLERAGQFGDMFGSINALFTALAFVAVWWTGRMQRRELELQRQALELQQQELAETRRELARTAEAQEQQLEASALESERRLRAYVNVREARCQRIRPQSLAAFIDIRNYGQTPAYALTPRLHISIGRDFNTQWEARALPPATALGVLSPSADFRLMVESDVSQEDMEMVGAEIQAIYVHGSFSYVDAFGKTRTTHLQVRVSGQDVRQGTAVTMASCPNGNDAD